MKCKTPLLLGNEYLSVLTATGSWSVRAEIEDFGGVQKYAEYSAFHVAAEIDKYRLTVSGYSGDAGRKAMWNNGSDIDLRFEKCSEYISSVICNIELCFKGARTAFVWFKYILYNFANYI